MKSVSKTLLAALFLTPGAHATVFNVDCTTTYIKAGVGNSARAHGTITIANDLGSPVLMLPLLDVSGQAPYYAHAQFNVRPAGTNSDWRLWFSKEPASNAIKEWKSPLSLVDVNQGVLQDTPSSSETLSFSCSFGKASNSEDMADTPQSEIEFDRVVTNPEPGGADTEAL